MPWGYNKNFNAYCVCNNAGIFTINSFCMRLKIPKVYDFLNSQTPIKPDLGLSENTNAFFLEKMRKVTQNTSNLRMDSTRNSATQIAGGDKKILTQSSEHNFLS